MTDRPDAPSRRAFLGQASAGLAALAAGCLPDQKGSPDPDESADPEDSAEDSASDTAADTATDTATDTADPCEEIWPDPPEITERRLGADLFREEGPNHREDIPARDRLNVLDREGVRLRFLFLVLDRSGAPLPGVRIDLWHVDQDGFYDLHTDNYEFYGVVTTDAAGVVRFETLRPSNPPEDDGVKRPQHIHAKLVLEGYETLFTQIKFTDDPSLDEMPDAPVVVALVDDGCGGLLGSVLIPMDAAA